MNRIVSTRARAKRTSDKSGFAKTKVLVAFLGLVICVGYLCIINISAVKGYEIRKIENKISELKKENKRLQIEAAELNSSYNMKDEIENLNMVKASDVVYISEGGQAVAIKR